TQARLQYMQGQYEQCLASLRRLLVIAPDHATILLMLKDVLINLKAWSDLLELLKTLQKKKLISNEEALSLTEQAYVALFVKAKNMGGDAPTKLWQELPASWTQNAELLLQYIPHLLAQDAQDEAEALLKKGIKKAWDPRLVRYYGWCLPLEKDKQLKTAQAWLKAHSEDPILLMTLGRLLYREELWGLAREYLEKSVAISLQPETYLLLGDLYAKLQDTVKSQYYYQQGLQLACQTQM
ncbi:MAG TPA: hypothetical protein VI522_06480, partial [Gammaproteobacteria bacterium]|nr:hypothetical protein [Gammaproteobacteria bacterium]